MKKVFLFVVIGLLLLAIPATIFFLGQQRDIRTRAAPATTLALTPATQTVKTGDTFKLNVAMNPGPNQVVTADIYLTYDATKLTATAITNGSSAPRVLNSGIVGNGTASIRVGAVSNAQPITTAGTIAIVTFTATAPTTQIAPAAVQFASNTFVGGLVEETANVLVGTTGSKVTITGTTTITPTLSPTSTPSGTLTPTLTPTLPASESAESSPSALTIDPLAEEGASVSAQPVIRGTAPPGSTVTIVIHSDPITVVVTADENGNYVYTPTTPLTEGLHEINVSIQTASGSTITTSESFVVGQGGGTETLPISGNIETTILLISLALFLLVSGAVLPIFIR